MAADANCHAGTRPLLWQCVRAGSDIQFPQGVPHSRRAAHHRRAPAFPLPAPALRTGRARSCAHPAHTNAPKPADMFTLTGELQEPSKKAILRVTAAQDALMEGSGDSKVSDSKYEI